jgi:hypothetical protein
MFKALPHSLGIPHGNLLAFTCAALLLLGTLSSCHDAKTILGPAAKSFQEITQSKLDRYCPDLADRITSNNRESIETALATIYAETEIVKGTPYGFLAVLDSNGVTLAAKSRYESSSAQNYGHYHIVSQVLEKRKVLQSKLYLQGGQRVFIICAPLLRNTKANGVLILGIDQDFIHRAGITEQEFMALTFTNTTMPPP